jgi:hypothetical protein
MDNNRTNSVDQAPEKRKIIKKKNNQKLKANFYKEEAQESSEEENLNFSEIDEKLRQKISLLCGRILEL